MFLSPDRPPPFLGRPSGAWRSTSYHHIQSHSPQDCHSDNIHSDPLRRKTKRSIHPVEAARIVTAQSYRGQRGHTTCYVIVNEHEARKKLLCSATRIPRHYLTEESAEILELHPRNNKCYTPRTTHYQPHPHPSQQDLTAEEEENEKKGRIRLMLGNCHRPCSFSDLHETAHFYIGKQKKSYVSINHHTAQGRHGEDEEEDDEGNMDWGDLESNSQFKANWNREDPLLVQTRCHVHSPGRRYQSPNRIQKMESYVKPKMRPQLETPLTEFDSASLASSSDQQNNDQYIQVTLNWSEAQQEKLAKKKSKTSFESHDLISSDV